MLVHENLRTRGSYIGLVFLGVLMPAALTHPGCPGSRDVNWSLLLRDATRSKFLV